MTALDENESRSERERERFAESATDSRAVADRREIADGRKGADLAQLPVEPLDDADLR